MYRCSVAVLGVKAGVSGLEHATRCIVGQKILIYSVRRDNVHGMDIWVTHCYILAKVDFRA